MSELKPCPFCGSSEVVSEAVSSHMYDDDDAPVCWVCCDECGAITTEARTSAEAEANWNTRADIPWLPDWIVRDIHECLERGGVNEIRGTLRDILAALEPRK